MRTLICLLLCCLSAFAQPYKQNSFTTNAVGRTPPAIVTSTSALYPLMVLNPDGSGTDRVIQHSPYLIMTGTNAALGGDLSLSGKTNRIRDTGSALTYNGVAIGGGSSDWSDDGTVLQNTDQTNNLVIFDWNVGNVLLSTWVDSSASQAYPWGIAGLFNDVIIGPTFLPSNSVAQNIVVVGYNTAVNDIGGLSSVAVGNETVNNATNLFRTVAIGYEAGFGTKSDSNSVFIGSVTGPALGQKTTNNIYIGTEATSGVGNYADVISIGHSATVSGNNSIALGKTATAAFANSVAIGSGATATAANQIRLGTATETVSTPGGIASTETTAAVSIAAGGWTNTFGKNAVVYLDGTALTYTVYNNAGTAIYTNAVSVTGEATIILQPSGKVLVTSGTGVNGRATPF